MTFEKWFDNRVKIDNYGTMWIVERWSRDAWDHQQAIIDELNDELENERQRADEYFNDWDNLRKESER